MAKIAETTTYIIQSARRRIGLSQGELADETGVPRTTMSDYMTKRPGQMPLSVLKAIVRRTGMTDEEIIRIVRS